MKYIVFTTDTAPLPLAVTFNAPLTHLAMANMLGAEGYKPRSAGFVTSDGLTFGESASLKLKSRPEDAELIRRVSANTLLGVPSPCQR